MKQRPIRTLIFSVFLLTFTNAQFLSPDQITDGVGTPLEEQVRIFQSLGTATTNAPVTKAPSPPSAVFTNIPNSSTSSPAGTTIPSRNLSFQPITPIPIPFNPLTPAPLLSAPVSLAPATPAPTTPAPVTPAPITSVPVTLAPTTPAPVTPAPTTPAPVIPAPITPAPVIPAPITPAPVTPAPITPAPVTPAPITPAPVTPAPITPAPVTPAPITPAPVTPAPITPAPVTPAPITPAPVTPAPITPAPVTLAPITPEPVAPAPVTTEPVAPAPISPAPVIQTPLPSAPVTKAPVTQVTSTPISPAPVTQVTSTPSISTKAPVIETLITGTPTTEAPMTPSVVPLNIKTNEINLEMVMNGMELMDQPSIRIWERITENYVKTHFTNQVIISSTVKLISQDLYFSRKKSRSRRFLQADQLKVEYTQILKHKADDITVTQLALLPFDDNPTSYIDQLKQNGDSAFYKLSSIEVSNPNRLVKQLQTENFSLWMLIAIAVGATIVLAGLLGGVFYVYKRGKNHRKGYFANVGDPPTSIKAGPDEVSTLAEPVNKSGIINTGGSVAEYGEESLATVDYDYEGAYGGAANHSVSSAGGTFGSNPQALGANQGAMPPGTGHTLGSFSDDGSFGDAGRANVREELIDIYAPAGKLGVVIDTPDDGAPVVHAIKDSSVIADKLQVGDKLVAVDDEDVRTMTAIKVSKLISRKSANPTRKLSIIRATLVE